MLYRIKIPHCIDVVIEFPDLGDAEAYARELNELICRSNRIYIHLLERRGDGIIEVFRKLITEDHGGSTP